MKYDKKKRRNPWCLVVEVFLKTLQSASTSLPAKLTAAIYYFIQEHVVTLIASTLSLFTFPLHGFCQNYYSVRSDFVWKVYSRRSRAQMNMHTYIQSEMNTCTQTHTPSFRSINSLFEQCIFSSV